MQLSRTLSLVLWNILLCLNSHGGNLKYNISLGFVLSRLDYCLKQKISNIPEDKLSNVTRDNALSSILYKVRE